MNFMHEQNKTPRSGRDFREFLFRLCKVAYTFQAVTACRFRPAICK